MQYTSTKHFYSTRYRSLKYEPSFDAVVVDLFRLGASKSAFQIDPGDVPLKQYLDFWLVINTLK